MEGARVVKNEVTERAKKRALIDLLQKHVFWFLGEAKSMKNRSVQRYMRILNLFLTNPQTKRQRLCKRSNLRRITLPDKKRVS